MRQIKFRAWHKKLNQMSGHLEDIEFDLSFGDMKFHSVCFDTFNGNFDTEVWYSGDIELMQFIGLTDKNGVDIYQRDIVSDHVGIGEVKYSDKHAAFRVVYSDGMAKWFQDYNLKGERESIEVIGNTHENPELLESKS